MLKRIRLRTPVVVAAGLTALSCLACAMANEAQMQQPEHGVEAARTQDQPGPVVSAAASPAGSPETIVQAQLDAYNARDIDAFMATFHPDAELFAIGDPSPRAAGRAAVREIYADLFARSPDLHSELVHRAVLGSRVVDHEHITGRQGGDVLEIVMVYEVEDGGIRRAWSVKSPT